MLAAVRTRYGAPEVIRFEGVPWGSGLGRRHVRFPLPRADASLAAYLCQLMARDAYRPVVDRTFDFDELRDAYACVETGRKVGNVVVIMPGSRE